MSTTRVRLFVVEDQVKILKSQLKLLEASPLLEVVGTALNGEDALPLIEQLQPEVVLCDLGLPGISGIEVTRQVKARWPQIELLIFTIFEEEEKVLDAIKAGASGYLLKGALAEKIVEAIQDVRAGGTVIQPSLARRLLRHFSVPEAAPEKPEAATPDSQAPRQAPEEGKSLSNRETEILRLIAKGLSNQEAAGVLGLSKATIRTHLEHIYHKLDVTNRVEAVTEGIRKGIIEM